MVLSECWDQVNVGDDWKKLLGQKHQNEISYMLILVLQKKKNVFIRYENNCSLAVIFYLWKYTLFYSGDSYPR